MSALGGFTCPTRRDHSSSATDNKSRGLDLLPKVCGRIIHLFEGDITFLLSVSDGIICLTRQYHSPSVTNNQSQSKDHLLKLKVKSLTCTKVRSLSYYLYLVG